MAFQKEIGRLSVSTSVLNREHDIFGCARLNFGLPGTEDSGNQRTSTETRQHDLFRVRDAVSPCRIPRSHEGRSAAGRCTLMYGSGF